MPELFALLFLLACLMETLFVTRDSRLRRRENTLAVELNGVTRALPVERIAHLVLLGETRLNTRLLCLCGKHGVRISVFDYYGNFKGAFEPSDRSPAGEVKLRHARLLLDDARRLSMAREIVRGAAYNMAANLRYYRYRGCDALAESIAAMDRLLPGIDNAHNTAKLMGIEGSLHQWYYHAWKHIDPALDFTPRKRRPPNNPVNCLLSFLNQLTYAVAGHELSKTHLEQSFAFLHTPGRARSSLSLDLAEPFKPVLVDRLILRMIRRRMTAENWFTQQHGVCLLSETGRRQAVEKYSAILEDHFRGHSYREWIYKECLAIERHVMDVAEYNAFRRSP